MKKELKPILIITYYWPPSGGAGVQRWLKFSKYLPEHGWRPIIFTPENPDFDLKDESLLKDIHPEVEVLKFPIWEPYRIFKKLSGQKELKQGQILESSKKSFFKQLAIWIRGNMFVPDPKVFWVKSSVNYLQGILESNEIKHMVTTGPPHSMHLIGMKLKMKVPSLTWIADFRDPWTKWEILHEMKISRAVWRKHQKLEQQVFKVADSLLVTSPSAKEEFKELGARRVEVITNGFDEVDFEGLPIANSDGLIISHVGMLSSQRNPKLLWEILSELALNHSLELRLTGIISDEVLDDIKANVPLSKALKVQDSIPHNELPALYAQSSVLLLIQTKTDRLQTQLPGKLFEYLQAKKPILCIGDTESDLARILTETDSGQCFSYDDHEGIAEFLGKSARGEQQFTFKNIDQFSRRKLTEKLAIWLTEL
ncbi:MAG: glycosyltransferase family 4 protein [Cytophagia bacterium]|nr:glycosyltransferase family 4 protein [Cytophagia bacterium]